MAAKKKKDKPTQPEESSADKAVLNGDSITIEDVKQFIEDGRKGRRAQFIAIADRSWNEIEKRRKDGQLYGGSDLEKFRRWQKFPLWWSCWQIRRPITFARLPIPTLKDTQSDDDPYGDTACIVGERLSRAILKTFEPFPEIEACNDDLLVTNFAWARWCYRNELAIEEEKIRLQVIPPEPQIGLDGQPMPPGPPIIINPITGQPVTEEPLSDENGPYLLTGEEIQVDNEEVYMEAGLYRNLYVEKDVTKWAQVNIIAFEYEYSYQEFKKKFGQKALDSLTDIDTQEYQNGKPIIVFEYHNKYINETRWFAEQSNDFFQPVEIRDVDIEGLKAVEANKMPYDYSDLYGLKGFFPCTAPLVINNMTRSFWPTPEYFQVCDLIDDIHQIVQRLMLLTKAIRCRFLYDSSVTELGPLAQETGEAGGLGVPNLTNALIQGKGSLATLVQYFPVAEMIEGLKNMYDAFDQRLNMFYNVTGISDLIRGQTDPSSDKTYGERQMEGKYAMNRFEPFINKLQEWIKNNYELGMEMALKLFSPKTLDEYICPQTLEPQHQKRYLAALELLKSNKRSRFRVDFETDATSAINEQWTRQQAIQTGDIASKLMESIANIAKESPGIAAAELKVAQHILGTLTDGKLFKDDIQQALQEVIDEAKQPKPPEPNYDLEKLKLEGAKLSTESTFQQLELQANTSLEYAKLSQKANQDNITNQLKQLQINIDSGMDQAELQLAVNKLQSDIAQGWEDLNIRKEEVLSKIQSEVGKKEMEQMRIILDARVKAQELTLAEADQALKAFEVQITAKDSHASLEERIATEQRLQEEHHVDTHVKQVDAAATLIDALKPEPEKKAPISIDLSSTLHLKPKESKKEKPKK